MKRFTLLLIFLVCWTTTLHAATAPVTVEIREISPEQYQTLNKKSAPIPYTLLLKRGGKTVVSSAEEEEGGAAPEAETFLTRYCGVPAQAVVLKTYIGGSCHTGLGKSCGYYYDFRIYDPESWGLMDEFNQSDLQDSDTDRWTSHADGPHTIAVLRAGRYHGPKCRIYDLYTQPLPAKGPSFDCQTASNRAEETVCKHPQLAALDRAYGARPRERLLKASPADRQAMANGYYWDMMIRDDVGTNVKDLAAAYRRALGEDSARFFKEKTPVRDAKADCEQARTPTEGALCANAAFKTLDSQMAQAYHQAFARTTPKTPERQALIQAQRDWLKTRDACKADVPCLEKAYQGRIRVLTGQAQP